MRGTSLIANVLQDNVGDEINSIIGFTADLFLINEIGENKMSNNLILMKQGESKTLKIQFKDGSGTAVDITGFKFVFTVKEYITDLDAAAKIVKKSTVGVSEIEIINAAQGIIYVYLIKADTNTLAENEYVWDCRAESNSGGLYYTIEGKLELEAPVTSSATVS